MFWDDEDGGERHASISPPIPEEGLQHVLGVWIGRGDLVPTLELLRPEEIPVDWSNAHTRTRADYVVFLELLPTLSRLPTRVVSWLDLLPAQSVSLRATTSAPTAGTSWVETRRRLGWPPTAFANRTRFRVTDELLSTTLAWVLRRVLALYAAAERVDPLVGQDVRRQLLAAATLVEQFLAQSPGLRPSHADLVAVEREGGAWRSVASAARKVFEADDAVLLASRLVMPELRPMFFHLGVLGTVLLALQAEGAVIVSRAPLGHVSGQEQYHVDVAGRRFHLWLEAAGAWHRYRVQSPYRHLSAVLPGQNRPLSPDVLLICPGEAALVIECKYSTNPDYIGRRGLAQSSLYAAELHGRLVSVVDAFVVPPETSATGLAKIYTPAGQLGIARPSDIREVVSGFIARLP